MVSESNSGERKAAIVTGSGTGVGAATALLLAEGLQRAHYLFEERKRGEGVQGCVPGSWRRYV